MAEKTTDQAEEAQMTPEDAEQQLADLEQKVIDGEDVAPADLVDAEVKIKHARLFQKGREARAEKQRQREADELREQTKKDVAKMFTAGPYEDPLIAYDQAVAALDRLVTVIDRNNKLLFDAYLALNAGDVAARGPRGDTSEKFDHGNHAFVRDGLDVAYVVLGGVTYQRENVPLWVRAAAWRVAETSGGLPLPHGAGHLSEALRGDRPVAITNRGK
jgi:hypothetical protein